MAAIIILSLRDKPGRNINKLEFLLQIEPMMNQNQFYIIGDDLLRVYYRDTHILPSSLNKLVNSIKQLDHFRQIVIDMYHTTNLHKV